MKEIWEYHKSTIDFAIGVIGIYIGAGIMIALAMLATR